MDAHLAATLQEEVLLSFNWTQPLIHNPSDGIPPVNLAEAVGPLAKVPENAMDQPNNNRYLNGSCFRLPEKFIGSAAAPQVKSFFEELCEGTSLSLPRGVYSKKDGKVCMDIHCSCGRLNKNAKKATFTDGKMAKDGTKRESVKRKPTENEEHITKKMRKWDKKRGQKKTKQQEKMKRVVDTREGGAKEKKAFQARRSIGKMPANQDFLCKFKLKLIMDPGTEHWWLMSDSVIEHTFHPPVRKEAQKGNESDITPEQMKFIMQMYRHSIPPATMSHIMSNLVGKDFFPDTLANLTKKCQDAMDLANGISPNLSAAKKTLERLRA